jgi:NAD(P)H-hydrate epimerase
VDGLLGTGLQGEVRSPYRELIEQINACARAFVIAIDIPSGLHADTGEPLGAAVRADLTVTMGLPKMGLLKPAAMDYVGELEVVDIGIPPQFVNETPSDVELVAPSDIAPLLPRRKRSAHKGDFGHLLVLAGAEGYHGAAVLCAEAAARGGAGLVTLGVPQRIYPVVAAQCREVMVRPFSDTSDGSFALRAAEEMPSWFEVCDAVALGPGLSQNEETKQFVGRILRDCPRPMVVDADGLNALAGHAESLAQRESPTILTPHPGEMARLIARTTKEVQWDRWGVARRFAKQTGMTVVLKGAGTVIASPHGPLWVNMTGGPALAKGGSGDILTGMIGSFLAQGFAPLDAARAGVFLHGRAADLAARELTDRAVLARDVLAQLGEAFAAVVK